MAVVSAEETVGVVVQRVHQFDAQLIEGQTRGVPGLLGCWAILAHARLAARHLQDDLRYYVNHGAPSPRKQRQMQSPAPWWRL